MELIFGDFLLLFVPLQMSIGNKRSCIQNNSEEKRQSKAQTDKVSSIPPQHFKPKVKICSQTFFFA